jgi:hypothetical protein
MVPPMPVASAAFSFFFHVGELTAAGDLSVPTDDASATEGGEAKQPNETHCILRGEAEQLSCR